MLISVELANWLLFVYTILVLIFIILIIKEELKG